mmetsp:Transcript_16462/g.38580  ORF Transcript_16462/g.38580 Transcript_16462/m.38580 type:complete len:253 (-) Transcript_16462:367-1125(-)
MLSPPRPSVSSRSGDMQWSRSSSMIADRPVSPLLSFPPAAPRFCCSADSNRLRTKSTASWLLMTSQTPSHAMTMNSSQGSRLKVRTSGVATMSWSPAGNVLFCLYSKSPMARERLRSPLTRWTAKWPKRSTSTQPPALLMRQRSRGRSGLWSSERSSARPPRLKTARQSPALATTTASECTQHTSAVHPMLEGCAVRLPALSRDPALCPGPESALSSPRFCGSDSNSSMCKKAAAKAPAVSSQRPCAMAAGK